MKKPYNFINITSLVIINTLLIGPGLFAQNINTATDQSRHMLSPIVHIGNQNIQQSFVLNNINLPLVTLDAPGTVGARALKRILKNPKGRMQISFAPNVWMRSVIQKSGTQGYINYLKNIENIFKEAGFRSILQYAIFDFQRVDDPSEQIKQIIDFLKSKQGEIIGSIHVSGRYTQLERNGEIYPFDTKSKLYRFSPLAKNKEVKNTHFLFSDLNKYFLLPDGQLIRGIYPDEKTIMRRYKQIEDLKSISKRKVACLMCQKIDCAGNQNKNCMGRKQYFKNLGLSSTGGFSKTYLLYKSSI